MITIKVKHTGTDFQDKFPDAIKNGLNEIGKRIMRNASQYLKGKGAKASNITPGQYPVPVRTGHLRRSLNYASPSSNAKIGNKVESIDDDKVLIFNSAEYAKIIHEGEGSSKKYGRRPYLEDGYKDTDIAKEFGRGFNGMIHD